MTGISWSKCRKVIIKIMSLKLCIRCEQWFFVKNSRHFRWSSSLVTIYLNFQSGILLRALVISLNMLLTGSAINSRYVIDLHEEEAALRIKEMCEWTGNYH